MLKVAVLGLGGRGRNYGTHLANTKGVEIVSVCDKYQAKIDNVKKKWGVPDEGCFTDDKKFFAQGKVADVMVIATQDRDHYGHAMQALDLGYNLLLEKPVSPDIAECLAIEKKAREKGLKVLVCHVLRYSNYYRRIHDIIASGVLGEIMLIKHDEHIAYWHFAHSYVRGNWRREDETSPMLLAKCCHDLDLLVWLTGSSCEAVSSMGSLSWFTHDNPEKGADFCFECKRTDCAYRAEDFYLKRPLWVKVPVLPEDNGEEFIRNWLRDKSNPYARCVYACDNDVVDHQMCSMRFENGVTATLTMMGFSAHIGRVYEFFGTMGEIDLNEERDEIIVKRFSQPDERIAISSITTADGHGGGDAGLVAALYGVLTGEDDGKTTLAASVESHLMGIRAEQSRLAGGACMNIH